jgi:hypothetical protein|nr:MAG TPA: hypothetical protein [Caudoviricetes sp.]
MATKKKIKTYGVRGLMEWVCNIPVGKSHMRFEFTGGILTSYGNTPAKYVTKDLLQQTIIEHSELFKKKRIVLLSVVDTDEDEDKLPKSSEAPKSAESTEAPKPASEAKSAPSNAVAASSDDNVSEADTAEAAPEEATDEDDSDTSVDDGTLNGDADTDGERTPDGKLIVKVTSLDDAKSYLNEKCGIAVRELRSRAKIVEAAESNGVFFEGI